MNKSVLYTVFSVFCLLIFWLLFSEPSGLIVKIRINKNSKEFSNVYYLKKDKFKVVTGNKVIIFSEENLCLADIKKKKYWKGSRKEFNQLLFEIRLISTTSNMLSKRSFQKQLNTNQKKDLKSNGREYYSGKTDESEGIEIQSSPNFKSIAGYACREFLLVRDNIVVEQVWIAENLKNYLNYDLNLDLYRDYMESLLHHTDSKLYDHLELFMEVVENGFPMEITMYGDGKTTNTKVENLIKKKLDDSVFTISDDFEYTEIKKLLQ
nr:DUF4412 domain-containing protein [uncultured Marinifilum sp.]